MKCHLSRVRPVQDKGWGKLALQMITSCLVGQKSEEGSVGVVIMLEMQGKFSTVIQSLVEAGCVK